VKFIRRIEMLTGKGIEYSLRKTKDSAGDYIVRCWVDGIHYPDGDYYTDDWDDAVQTKAAMELESSKQSEAK
jgi:hypothetical protein